MTGKASPKQEKSLQTTLKKETKKWLQNLEKEVEHLIPRYDQAEEHIENLRAYIQDCKHFEKQGDYVRAFEAIIYAWGIYETLKKLHLV
jgi:hypothetical protein